VFPSLSPQRASRRLATRSAAAPRLLLSSLRHALSMGAPGLRRMRRAAERLLAALVAQEPSTVVRSSAAAGRQTAYSTLSQGWSHPGTRYEHHCRPPRLAELSQTPRCLNGTGGAGLADLLRGPSYPWTRASGANSRTGALWAVDDHAPLIIFADRLAEDVGAPARLALIDLRFCFALLADEHSYDSTREEVAPSSPES
jgi:hypothetical protein